MLGNPMMSGDSAVEGHIQHVNVTTGDIEDKPGQQGNAKMIRDSLLHLLDGIILLYHIGAHKQLGKVAAQRDSMNENVMHVLEIDKKMQYCREKVLIIDWKLCSLSSVYSSLYSRWYCEINVLKHVFFYISSNTVTKNWIPLESGSKPKPTRRTPRVEDGFHHKIRGASETAVVGVGCDPQRRETQSPHFCDEGHSFHASGMVNLIASSPGKYHIYHIVSIFSITTRFHGVCLRERKKVSLL